MKEIRFSQHAELKLEVLGRHGMTISPGFVIATIRSPDRCESEEGGNMIAQKLLDENRVLRVVYREFNAFLLVITLYPGKRSRYEKD